ncbi:MAG: sialate O-acetylesterase [Bacteroidales bacterium]|nr:sialate O-acetylesterase [Bacteroidales bacterium]
MRRVLFVAALLLASFSANAKLTVNKVFSDGMVLQQNADAAIWGTADPGAKVSVSVSWAKKGVTCVAGEDGKWKISLRTPAASYIHQTVSVKSGKESIDIQNVLVGEVWFASGQSNMEMPMRGFFNCPVRDADKFINAKPDTDGIRMFMQKKGQSYEPVEDADGQWNGASPATVAEMSATAFFFAHKLHEMLDVPVGIVCNAYGGSRVEGWLPKSIHEAHTDEDLDVEHIKQMSENHRPYVIYNAVLNPLKGYTVKGFIWYQGCSNVGAHETFVERMGLMVEHWRSLWGDTDAKFPFYQVEIAPCDCYGGNENYSSAALLRAAQHEAARTIPNSAIVVTNDLAEPYEAWNIHPCQKQQVGERLAILALNRDYGFAGIHCYSPVATRAWAVEGGVAVEVPDVKWNGFDRTHEINGLEVKTADGAWHKVSDAAYSWEKKYLEINNVDSSEIVEVRYGWGDFVPGNLKDCFGMPLTPFDLKVEK